MTAEETAFVAVGIGFLIACAVLLKMGVDWVVKDWKLSNCKHSCMTSARIGRAYGNLNPRSEYEYFNGCVKRCDERIA